MTKCALVEPIASFSGPNPIIHGGSRRSVRSASISSCTVARGLHQSSLIDIVSFTDHESHLLVCVMKVSDIRYPANVACFSATILNPSCWHPTVWGPFPHASGDVLKHARSPLHLFSPADVGHGPKKFRAMTGGLCNHRTIQQLRRKH